MSPARMEKIESATRVVLTFVEARNRRDTSALLACLSDDCVLEDPAGKTCTGKHEIARLLADSSPAILEIEDVSGMGARCILRWKEKNGTTRGLDLFQVQNGLICNIASYLKTYQPPLQVAHD
jgi:hypothetical protein